MGGLTSYRLALENLFSAVVLMAPAIQSFNLIPTGFR
jgi:hypothetical protein